ncbi:SH3 domain-containing protein [Chryseobacterium sp.]|uniref:SH3 domain-containing protein n=1 Tax=Chryseobacterium sp. TaxID=1871047 RepID=UPI00388EBB1E
MNKLLIMILTLLISCKSPSQESKLQSYNITELKESFNDKSEKQFLNNFPRDFLSLKNIFGWNDENDIPNPLYQNANEYIDYWFSLLEKPQYAKNDELIISISKNGIWEADAVNYFRIKSLKYISKNKKYNLINNLSQKDAESVLNFLIHPKSSNLNDNLIANLNIEKQKIVKKILFGQDSKEKKRSSLATYQNNDNYFIKTFDINKDGLLDKVVSSRPYKGNDLFLFFGDNHGNYKLSLETINFSEDGGNIIQDFIPIASSKGFTIITSFPDRGYYEKEYQIVMSNNSWSLKNITYKTMSDNSENAVKYICEVPQNIDITKSGWTEKINPIPEEKSRNKKCRVEKVKIKEDYSIQDSDGYTNLRKDKNPSSEIIKKIKTGEKIELLDKNGDWYLVQTKDGQKGYVHKSRIK